MAQDLSDRPNLDDCGNDLELAATMTALFDVDIENSGEEFSPAFSFGALRFLRGLN